MSKTNAETIKEIISAVVAKKLQQNQIRKSRPKLEDNLPTELEHVLDLRKRGFTQFQIGLCLGKSRHYVGNLLHNYDRDNQNHK